MRLESGRFAAGTRRPSGVLGGHTWKMAELAAHWWDPCPAGGLEDQRAVPQTDTARDATDPLRSRELIPEREDQVCRKPARGRSWQLCLKEPRSATGSQETRGADTAGR